jgi:hypothetical protein
MITTTGASRTFDALSPTSPVPADLLAAVVADYVRETTLAAVAAILAMPVRDGYALYYPAK